MPSGNLANLASKHTIKVEIPLQIALPKRHPFPAANQIWVRFVSELIRAAVYCEKIQNSVWHYERLLGLGRTKEAENPIDQIRS